MVQQWKPGHPVPQGEPRRYETSHGYVKLRWRVDGQEYEVYEHRWVTQCFDPDLHVHHLNHDPLDNRRENLQVVDVRMHRRLHRSIDVERAALLYEQGWGTPDIAKELGCSTSQVFRRLRDAGVRIRSISEAKTRLQPKECSECKESFQPRYRHQVTCGSSDCISSVRRKAVVAREERKRNGMS